MVCVWGRQDGSEILRFLLQETERYTMYLPWRAPFADPSIYENPVRRPGGSAGMRQFKTCLYACLCCSWCCICMIVLLQLVCCGCCWV